VSSASGPLAGITVVALEQAVSAPMCTRCLGDLGARIIKVENLKGGDFARSYDTTTLDQAAHFVWANRNKESLAIDLKTERGARVLRQLVERADVVVQNLAPGAAARLGVAAEQVVAQVPTAVGVDISGYGAGGPYEERRAYDLLVQSESGSCSITGWPDAPAKPGIPLADIGSGMHAYSAVLAALFDRQRTGRGAALHIGMFDVMADWMGWALNQARYGAAPMPNGVSSPMVAPYGAYRTGDDQTAVLGTTNDREWQRLAREIIERPDLADDPAYATNAQRVEQRAALDEAIGAWVQNHTLAQVEVAANAAGIGVARLNSVEDVVGHPQLAERGRWQPVSTPNGPVLGVVPPVASSTWGARMDPVPALGEHTDAILGELGYSASDIASMRSDAVI
jgi:crotonobetainyl-CoA:carnitine CoA-transferase CaiB-like acyl-CoA transferase